MKFEPYGPFEMPRFNGGIDRRQEQRNSFWDSIEDEYPSLPDAIGCYIFALKAAKGFTPWYVGKTEKQSFKSETWKASKLLNYGDVIKGHNGKPVLFLLAKITPNDRFAKPTKRKIGAVAALEEMLIGTCLRRNGKLLNKKSIRFAKGLHVPGYINGSKGAPSKNAKALAQLLKT